VRAELDTALAALADPARRGIVDVLRGGPRRSSDLARELSLSRPAVSRHLRVLRRAGVVQQDVSESDARVRMVHLRRAPFTELRGWIDEVEAFWAGQLGAFQVHAEQRRRGRAP
jgi:DNA-binding transcriptional ArsR family regulator